jgi:creatinine amidohydrolase
MAKTLHEIIGAEVVDHYKNAYVALIGLGSCEFHGPHAPLGTDAIIAQEIAMRAADKLNAEGLNTVVVPLIPFGYSLLHETFPGTISIRCEVLTELLKDVFNGLVRNGVKFIMIVNGHDGNAPAIDIASYEFRAKHPEVMIAACTYWDLTRGVKEVDDLYTEDPFKGKGHGGAEEMALVMAAGGPVDLSKASMGEVDEAVIEQVGQPRPYLYHGLEIFLSTEEWAPMGYDGDARIATAEKGERDYEFTVNNLVKTIKKIKKAKFPPSGRLSKKR